MNKKIDKISKVLSLVLAFVMVLGVAIPALATDVEEVKPTLEAKIEQTKEQAENNKATLKVTQTKAKDEDYEAVHLAFETSNNDKQEKQVMELDEVKTSANITQAKEQLQAIVDSANDVDQIETAESAEEVEEALLFTSPQELTDFINAIKQAKKALEWDSVKNIDDASRGLIGAINNYLEAQEYGTKKFQGDFTIPVSSFDDKGVATVEIDLPAPVEKEQTVTVTATLNVGENDEPVVTEATIVVPSSIVLAKEALEAKLEEAENVEIVATSKDGKDIVSTKKYTSPEAKEAFEKVVANAKEALAKEGVTTKELNIALIALTNGIREYEEVKTDGLAVLVEPKDIIDGKATVTPKKDTNYYDFKDNLLFTVNRIKDNKAYITYPDGRKLTVDVKDEKITLAVVAAPTEQVVNINVYTADMGVDKKVPVVGSKFEVYHAKRAEDNSLSLGKLYTEATTDDKGNITLVLPLTEKEIIFTGNDENTTGYDFFQVPYLIKQVDGGKDEKVRPYEELIMAEGYYDLDGFKGEANSLTIGVDPSGKEINIEIKNKRDEAGRIEGEDIFETSVELAKDMYPNGSKKVVIATANEEKLADALTAGSLANLYDAPILLVNGENISDTVRDYLRNPNNGIEEIVLIGGKNTINEKTEELLNFWFPESVTRIQGSNRFQTAVEVAKIVQEESEVSNFIVANGEGNDKFVDALSATAVAGEFGYPVLVTSADELVKEAADFIKDSKAENVYVIGGKTSIKEDVVEDLAKVLDKEAKVERFAGANRNETAVAVAKAFFPEADHAVYVNGDDNQLVLVAGTYAAKLGSPVILVGVEDVPVPVEEYLPTSAIKDGTVIGSVESVTEEVRLALGALVR